MSTYREIVYMCLDELQIISDDAKFTPDHIIFLADKYRAFLLKKNYFDLKKDMPESDYQTLCLNLEEVQGVEGDDCSNIYLRSIEKIPDLLNLRTPEVSSLDPFGGEITYVSRERFKYVGWNKFLKNIIYSTIGSDNKLYLKSNNPQAFQLEKVRFSGTFENTSEASELSCDKSSEDNSNCDVLDRNFPLEDALIPIMIELIVKELSGAIYRPADDHNNANDDLDNKTSVK